MQKICLTSPNGKPIHLGFSSSRPGSPVCTSPAPCLPPLKLSGPLEDFDLSRSYQAVFDPGPVRRSYALDLTDHADLGYSHLFSRTSEDDMGDQDDEEFEDQYEFWMTSCSSLGFENIRRVSRAVSVSTSVILLSELHHPYEVQKRHIYDVANSKPLGFSYFCYSALEGGDYGLDALAAHPWVPAGLPLACPFDILLGDPSTSIPVPIPLVYTATSTATVTVEPRHPSFKVARGYAARVQIPTGPEPELAPLTPRPKSPLRVLKKRLSLKRKNQPRTKGKENAPHPQAVIDAKPAPHPQAVMDMKPKQQSLSATPFPGRLISRQGFR
ncbi:hypothetical protein B0H10DRAFT_907397 [Mycena sp. CBHHK59/15]|nr:hypothetical protein B0H10DRAFT_907397 [Mycena sp. CBHHK59/15]